MRWLGLGLLVGLLVLAGLAAYNATRPYRTLPAAAGNAQDAQAKAGALEQAAAQARALNRPVAFSQTFSDADLTYLANQALTADSTFSAVTLHANAAGYVEGTGTARLAGQSLPVYARAIVVVLEERPSLQLTDARVGSLPAPGPVRDALGTALRTTLQQAALPPLQDLKVALGDGTLTVSGIATPG